MSKIEMDVGLCNETGNVYIAVREQYIVPITFGDVEEYHAIVELDENDVRWLIRALGKELARFHDKRLKAET